MKQFSLLLCACSQWPRHRHPADQRDELAPPHHVLPSSPGLHPTTPVWKQIPVVCSTANFATHVCCGSFTSFPPSRRVRFAPRADIRPMPACMSTHTSARTARSETFRFVVCGFG